MAQPVRDGRTHASQKPLNGNYRRTQAFEGPRRGQPWNSLFCSRMARPEGFEPPTPKFVVWCSIQLSYGRILAARGQKAPSGKVAGAAKPLSLVARAIKRKALVPVLGPGIIRSSTKLNGSPKGAARVNAGNGPAARCGNARPSCRRQASVCRRAPARVRRR